MDSTATETPTETLRRAADKLRQLATADGITPGPWRYDPDTYWNRSPFFGQEYVGAGPAREIDCVAGTGLEGQPGAAEDAAFIAAMHPGVGVALADWLESTAATVDAVTKKHPPAADPGAHWLAPALAVAAVVLGLVERETSPKPTGAPETPSERLEAPEPRRSTPGASGGDGEGFNGPGKPPSRLRDSRTDPSEAETGPDGGSPGLAASACPSLHPSP